MNGTGTGTSTGRSAGHPEPGDGGDAGPMARATQDGGLGRGPAEPGALPHPVGPADATGPLPVQVPPAATGPLPSGADVDPAAATDPGRPAAPAAVEQQRAHRAGATESGTTSYSWFATPVRRPETGVAAWPTEATGSYAAGVPAEAETASWFRVPAMPGEPTGAMPAVWQTDIPAPSVGAAPVPAADLFEATRSAGVPGHTTDGGAPPSTGRPVPEGHPPAQPAGPRPVADLFDPTATMRGTGSDRASREPAPGGFGRSAAPVRPTDTTGPMPAIAPAPPATPPAGRYAPGEPPPATGPLPRTTSGATGAWPVAPPPDTAGAPHPAEQPTSHAPADRSSPTAGSGSLDSATSAPRTGSWSFAATRQPSAAPRSEPRPSTENRTPGAGSPPPVSPPPGAPPAAPATSPAHAGDAHAGDAHAGDGDGSPRRLRWPLTVVGVLVAVAAGIALVFSVAPTDPGDLVATAVADVGSWNGARYQGAIAALDGGEIEFELVVTTDGAVGTLSRDGGRARAELLRDPTGTLLKANREWWLYHHPSRADDLAGSWVADPLTETQEIDPVLELHPAALAQHVRPGQQPAQWEALEQQGVEGKSAALLSDGERRVVVTTDEPHRLLALDVRDVEGSAPVRVSDIAAEEVGTVERAAAQIRSAEAPRSLTQRLLERPLVEIQLRPEPLCTTATCTVTVTVTNSGSVPARGRLEISADGVLVATHPLDVQPGQVATFAATAPNPQFTTPGSSGQILWESRAVDD